MLYAGISSLIILIDIAQEFIECQFNISYFGAKNTERQSLNHHTDYLI